MDCYRFLEALKRKVFAILVMVMTAVTAAGAASLLSPVTYQAKAVLWLARADVVAGTPGLDYNSLMMIRQLARTYGELAVSEPLLRKLSADVGGSLSPDDLRRMVSVRKVKDLEFLEISVRDVSPERAAYFANRLVMLLREEEKNTLKMNYLRVIQPASPDSRPVGPQVLLNAVTAGLTGLFLSFGWVAAGEYAAVKSICRAGRPGGTPGTQRFNQQA
ncbi:MAG: hypothetical protein K6T80_08425 [Firmicutes bacterium]|nr:hypothetical protein [Bacillota bacterium]